MFSTNFQYSMKHQRQGAFYLFFTSVHFNASSASFFTAFLHGRSCSVY
jgi:hypothetical protein